MSERPMQEPGPMPRVKQQKNRSWVGALVLILIIFVMLVAAYGVTLGPQHFVQVQAQRVSGTTQVTVGDPTVATVTPGAEWSTRPLVTPLFGELGLFKNPAVFFGHSPGVQLDSPDGSLTVTLEPLGGSGPEAAFAAAFGSRMYPDARVQEETLSTGLLMKHVVTGETLDVPPDGLVAVIEPAGGAGGASGTGGTGEATSLLVRVTLDADAKHSLDDYRPALSKLVESVKFIN